jgi:hypothetical protein
MKRTLLKDPNGEISEAENKARHDYWFERVAKIAENPPNGHPLMEKDNPLKAVTALMMLEQYASFKEVREKVGVFPAGLLRLKARHSESLQERRKEFSRRFASLAEMGTDALAMKFDSIISDPEELKNTSLKDIALATAIVTDKGSHMDGMPTVTIEHRKGSSIDDALKLREEARKRLADSAITVDAEIIS